MRRVVGIRCTDEVAGIEERGVEWYRLLRVDQGGLRQLRLFDILVVVVLFSFPLLPLALPPRARTLPLLLPLIHTHALALLSPSRSTRGRAPTQAERPILWLHAADVAAAEVRRGCVPELLHALAHAHRAVRDLDDPQDLLHALP